MLIDDEEYLAVYFSGPCDDPEDDCAQILEDLETVDSTMQVCYPLQLLVQVVKLNSTSSEIPLPIKVLFY